MAEAKHSFVDDYPYLVYTNEDTLVYSNKADTSIDDLPSGGGEEYDIECYSYGGTPQDPVITKVDPCAYLGKWDSELYQWVRTEDIITKAKAGTIIVLSTGADPTVLKPLMGVTSDDALADAIFYVMPQGGAAFGSCPMPSNTARFYYYDTE